MSWALLLLALSALCACASSQPTLTQPSSQIAPPGGTAQLPCTISSDRSTIHWYQQRVGGAPRFILYGTTGRGPGVPDRFTGSTSGIIEHLTITSVRGEDDGVYYCAMWYSNTWIFGGGTQMNVLSGETQAPTLSIFPPSLEEVEKNKATVVCLLQDFYPASLDVTWKVDGQIFTNGVEKSRATKQSENNLFMASSYLSLPPMDWSAEKTVTCQVTHQGKTFEKSVKKSECV